MDFKIDHPERKPNEIYLGNSTVDNFNNKSDWKSKRLGSVSYDVNGKEITRHPWLWLSLSEELYPMFVSRDEVASLLEEEKRNPNCLKEITEPLEKLLNRNIS